MSQPDALKTAQHLLDTISTTLKDASERPYGPACATDTRPVAGQACVSLCDNDRNRARTLWKLIEEDLGGYMPHAAAVALIRATNTANLVPDVQAPVPS